MLKNPIIFFTMGFALLVIISGIIFGIPNMLITKNAAERTIKLLESTKKTIMTIDKTILTETESLRRLNGRMLMAELQSKAMIDPRDSIAIRLHFSRYSHIIDSLEINIENKENDIAELSNQKNREEEVFKEYSDLINEGVPATRNLNYIFIVGCFGGLLREFYRWKNIIQKGIRTKYSTFKIQIYNIFEIILGGFIALIFQGLAPFQGAVFPIAFVCGAGSAHIVKLAVAGKVWRPKLKEEAETSVEEEEEEEMMSFKTTPLSPPPPSGSVISFIKE
ncbi:hypothetical protein ACFL6O_03205 [candidate division KSB1 bacterium]